MRPTSVIGVVVVAVTIAGCAADSADTDAAASPATSTTAVASDARTTPPTSPTPTPTPTTTTAAALSTDEAAERYLEIVRPYNEALEQLEQAINGGEPLETQTALAAETADELRDEIEQLRGTAWPSDMNPHVDDLVSVSEQALEHWSGASSAETQDELIQAVLAAGEFDGTEAAAAIRELLDLDAYEEGDYD